MTNDVHTSFQRRSISASSAASSSNAPQLDFTRRSHSPDTIDTGRNKPIGACSSCRRSKVKCEHDGTAPCKRCRNGGYECHFKPKELGNAFRDDEWRAKTDETLGRLVSAIDALVQQETSGNPSKRMRMDDPSPRNHMIRQGLSSRAGLSEAIHLQEVGRALSSRGAVSPRALPARAFHNSPPQLPYPKLSLPNLTTTQAWSIAESSRRPSAAEAYNDPISLPYVANGLSNTAAAGTEHEPNRDHPLRALLRARGSLPAPSLCPTIGSAILQSAVRSPLTPRASRYRYPDADLGSNDPRLDAIRLGLLSMHEARFLFAQYAKTIEPFGLGLPDFPASSDLTPVLLSAIASVASLHSPSDDLRARHLRLRGDILERTMPYAPTTADDEFNPESGIGTEEVVGACIWTAYEGSEEAWKAARAARWWSEKYSYETGPHAGLTVGEMVAILPPVRHVSIQDRVRVWLTAFLAELHQCEMHDKPAIMQVVDPAQYSQALVLESAPAKMAKQDVALVFYARVAYLVAQARLEGCDADGLVRVTHELTASWYTTRTLLASDPNQRDTWDHTLDLHYSLAKAYLLIQACRSHAKAFSAETMQNDIGLARATFVSRTQQCHSTCMDTFRLLLSPKAGFVDNLAVLPSIYHFWISRCAAFLLELCMPDRPYYRLGLLVGGQLDDILVLVGTFMQRYLAELSACDTPIEMDGQSGGEREWEVMRHPAMNAALVVAEMLSSVRATA